MSARCTPELRPPVKTTGSPLAVTLTVEELRELIREEMLATLDEYETGRPPPVQLVRSGDLALQLCCSRTTIHRLCAQGMPRLRVGDSWRFRVADVLEWLKERSGGDAPPPARRVPAVTLAPSLGAGERVTDRHRAGTKRPAERYSHVIIRR